MKNMHKTNKTHPLEVIVRAAFKVAPAQDATTLSVFMMDATFLTEGGTDAYYTVAKDVLGYMEAQQKIEQDLQGWYHLISKNKVIRECAFCGAPIQHLETCKSFVKFDKKGKE